MLKMMAEIALVGDSSFVYWSYQPESRKIQGDSWDEYKMLKMWTFLCWTEQLVQKTCLTVQSLAWVTRNEIYFQVTFRVRDQLSPSSVHIY